MRIGIDIRSTLKQKTGIGYYTLNLINNLCKIDPENQYILYSKIGLFNRTKKLPRLPGARFTNRVNRLNFNPGYFLNDVDIFHTSSYDLPKPKKSRLIVVVHDVIHRVYPLSHAPDTIKKIDENLKKILGESDKIIAVSHNTKNDIIKYYDVKEEKIKAIYSGIDESIFPLEQKTRGNERYLLYVGTIEPRKNIEGLITACNILWTEHAINHKLILAGMKGWLYGGVEELIKKFELKDRVIFTGYIDRKETNQLYNNADVFIYPSFYEGFGLPILEAFKCGVPVVTSNSSSCVEIAGDAAILIDPNKPEEIAKAILEIICDKNLQDDLRKRGLQRAENFSWQKTALQTLEVFQEVYKN